LKIPSYLCWVMAVAIALLVSVVPIVRYRWVYRHGKRFREVVPGQVYRSGTLSAPGFAEMIRQHEIRTVVNLMEDEPDPILFQSYFLGGGIAESALCKELKVRYVNLVPDLLTPEKLKKQRPAAIDEFLRLMDNPENYPVLLHCRAGLHRTGIFTAIYRMEYQGWTPLQAWREMKANGFGQFNCYADNPYIRQYLLNYHPGLRQASATGPRDTTEPQAAALAPPRP
jgi:tyrosine-protein phosphatase SIW14